MTGRRSTLAAVLAVVAAGGCWGFSAVIAKTAFDRGVSPVRMAEARVAVALAVLVAILAVRRPELLRPTRAAAPALVGFGLSIAAVNALYYVAIDRLPVGVAISIQYTAPVLLLALSAVLARFGARAPVLPAPAFGPLPWMAAAATLAGAALASKALTGPGGLSGPGLAAAVGSALSFATYLLSARWAAERGAHPATTLLWGFVVAFVAWSILAPWWSWPYGTLADARVAVAVVAVGLVATLLPFFLAVWAVRVLPPATAGTAATVEPPFATFFAWLFLGQTLGGLQILGAGLVVVGVVLAQRASVPARDAVAV